MPKIKFENILDQAIARIKNGEKLSAVLSSYPQEVQSQLAASLEIISLASSLPKMAVPAPIKRKAFLEYQMEKVSAFVRFMQSLKTVSAVAVAMLILAITGTVSAAIHSLPGDNLFALKRVIESAQLKLTQSQSSKTELELSFADQRLNEAQTVFSQNTDSNAKAQAVNELTQQTASTLNNIKAIAGTSSGNINSDIIKKAESIAQNQSNLLAKVDPAAAKQSSIQNQQAINDIKNLVAAAKETDQTTLPKISDIDVTGNVTAIDKSSISVDGNTYSFNTSMTVTDATGNHIGTGDISVNDKVHVKGKVDGSSNDLIAIILMQKAKKETNTNTGANGTIEMVPPAPEPNIPLKPIDTFGGFIIEPAGK